MNIRELKELTQILHFNGKYALFRANDQKGQYVGMINRKGEIIWNEKWHRLALQMNDYPNLVITSNGKREFIYYDVEQQTFTDTLPPLNRPKSKAELIVENAKEVPFFTMAVSYKSMRYLSDDYIAFSPGRGYWGVRDLEGNIILPAEYEDMDRGGQRNHFTARLDKLYGIIDDKGEWVIPCIYDNMFWRRYYVTYIKDSDGKRRAGLYDNDCHLTVPFEYDFIDPSPSEDLITVQRGKDIFFINHLNERIEMF